MRLIQNMKKLRCDISKPMKLFRISTILSILFVAPKLLAQDNQTLKALVVYDPLFWRNELKLDAFQYQKIRQINSEYYERLLAALHDDGKNRSLLKLEVAQSLLERSERIWQIFHPRQRKKWKKMWPDTSSQTSAVGKISSVDIALPSP